ncbi:MAG TPA: hypothetical protein VFN67_35405 [Polyangiales bacterium]|nr:hypothetical protein [Polyangiales bacterium]
MNPSYKQSSLTGCGTVMVDSAAVACSDDGPNARAARTPAQGLGGWGGRKRRAPLGGSA